MLEINILLKIQNVSHVDVIKCPYDCMFSSIQLLDKIQSNKNLKYIKNIFVDKINKTEDDRNPCWINQQIKKIFIQKIFLFVVVPFLQQH